MKGNITVSTTWMTPLLALMFTKSGELTRRCERGFIERLTPGPGDTRFGHASVLRDDEAELHLDFLELFAIGLGVVCLDEANQLRRCDDGRFVVFGAHCEAALGDGPAGEEKNAQQGTQEAKHDRNIAQCARDPSA